jgi:hypothetical protein
LRFWTFLPQARFRKPALGLLAVAILAGCGGQAAPKVQTVAGSDFHFQAPAGWIVAHSGSSVSAQDGFRLTRVTTYMLLKPYRHALLPGATRELNADVAKLATALKGKVTGRRTIQVAGHDARTYSISYGKKLQQITFVLDGGREFELICRIWSGTDLTPCRQLISSFAVS